MTADLTGDIDTPGCVTDLEHLVGHQVAQGSAAAPSSSWHGSEPSCDVAWARYGRSVLTIFGLWRSSVS